MKRVQHKQSAGTFRPLERGIQRYALDLARLHTDATSLKLSGAYARDDDEEGPLVTYGDSRDHRPDLKPRLFGLTVTAEGVPVWGHVTDGNQRDSTAPRVHITQLGQSLPALGAPLLVADSKCFAGETMALAAVHWFRFVTLVPQTVGLRQELVAAPEIESLPLLWEQPGRRRGQTAESRGASGGRCYRWKNAAGELQEWSWRFLVVESTPLAKVKTPRLTAAPQAEKVMLAALQPRWQRRRFACAADAQQAATLGLRERRLPSHHLTSTVSAEWAPAKRAARGRPPKGAPRPQHQVWRVTWQGPEATAAISRQAPRERRCVLATNVLAPQHLSAAERLRAYTGQPAAALRFTWAKNPAAIAPIFLETPTRIAALGCVYLMALLV